MNLFDLFSLIALIYVGFAVGVLVRLIRAGKATFDDRFTAQDRKLAAAVSFYLCVPFAVILHELGHAAATWSLGGYIKDWGFIVYGGWVQPARAVPFEAWEHFTTAAAGNAVSLLLGFGLILWVRLQPINAALNFVRFEVARILLWLTLAFYPLLSLLLGVWDFHIMRVSLNHVAPHAGNVFVLAYGAFAVFVWRKWRGPWQRTYIRMATPLFDRMRNATHRLADDPESIDALRDLARAFLSGDDPARASRMLSEALRIRPDEPEIRYLAGLASLRLGAPHEASEHLRVAGKLLESSGEIEHQAGLYLEVVLGLSAARLALDDAEGAVLTAEAARSHKPDEPRAVLILVDALITAGRTPEAHRTIEQALPGAKGLFADELVRRRSAIAPQR